MENPLTLSPFVCFFKMLVTNASTSSSLFVQTCGTSFGSETKLSCRQIVEYLHCSFLPLLMFEMARASQPHKLAASNSAAVTRDCPTDRRGAGHKRQETRDESTHTARGCQESMLHTTMMTSKNNIEPQTNVARQSPEYSHL